LKRLVGKVFAGKYYFNLVLLCSRHERYNCYLFWTDRFTGASNQSDDGPEQPFIEFLVDSIVRAVDSYREVPEIRIDMAGRASAVEPRVK